MKSTIEEASALHSLVSPSEEEQRALVKRVVGSAPFRRSARLRDFLLYVAAQSLRDPHAELGEQEIGEKVFGRAASYDRSQDNIVRVNATELRRRMEQYFLEEGADETLLLEIPRGGYKPVFRYRAPALRLAQTPPPEPAPAPLPEVWAPAAGALHPVLPLTATDARRVWWPTVILALGTVLLAGVCGVLWHENRVLRAGVVAPSATPALTSFWGSFEENHQQVDIVLPDDAVSVVEDITHQSITLQDYFRGEYTKHLGASGASADRKMDLEEIASHDLITFGDAKAAQLVMGDLPGFPVPHLALARYYTADAMKRNNLVLIGGSKANPWVHLLDDQMNFQVDYDYPQRHAVVLNTHPRPGEQVRYVAPTSGNALTGYSVVSYLPNPSQNGRAIVLAGMDADSTSAAAEFLTSEEQMEQFEKELKVKELPYFQVLLRTSRVKGTAFHAEIVAYRTYATSK